MFARVIIIAAAVALASAHVKREHQDDYSPDYEHHDVDYKPDYKPEYKPAYEPAYKPAYKDDKYDKAYDYAFEHYAHEAKEDRRGLGYGETWEDNFERRNDYESAEYKPEYEAPKSDYQPEYQPEYEAEPEYKPEYEEKSEYDAPKPCDDYSCYTDEEHVPAPVSNCNTGNLQCCNQVQSAKTVDFSQFKDSEIYELIPNQLRGSNVPVGLACSPIIADTSGGAQCNQQSVCCDGGHFSGLFSVNCNAFNGGSQSAGIF